MHEEIIISGFGGQGVLFAGQMLAYAGVEEGRYVTLIPSYGPEMRGGTAHCTVIISSEEIGSPLAAYPSAVIALNEPSMERYAPLVKPGGMLVVDSSLVVTHTTRDDVHELYIPAKDIAAELGFPQSANVAMLGALAAATDVVKLETLEKTLEEHIGARHLDALDANKQALRRGCDLAIASRQSPVKS